MTLLEREIDYECQNNLSKLLIYLLLIFLGPYIRERRALRGPRAGVSAERRVSSAKLPGGISPGTALRVIKGRPRMASLRIIDSILVLDRPELISYDFRRSAVQSRAAYLRRTDIAELRRHRAREEARSPFICVASIKAGPMHMDEPIAGKRRQRR